MLVFACLASGPGHWGFRCSSSSFLERRNSLKPTSQRLQYPYPLLKEYSLNCSKIPSMS